jgi:hypothetical protein
MGDGLERAGRGGGGETAVIQQSVPSRNGDGAPLVFAWLAAADGEEIHRIASETFTVGSAAGRHLVLAGEGIVDDHCAIYHADGQFEINDHNTHGATRVNDQPAKRQPIVDGDLIGIGRRRFVFHCFQDQAHG